MLRDLPPVRDPNLLAGSNPADDSAIYRLTDELALVQSVDFFTPIVDDPYMFGRIAAANSLSDIYAAGGRPLIALNIAAFPVKSLPLDVLSEILRGGADKAQEAGISIVGGHTIDDEEPKYGLAVTGIVHPNRFVSPRGAAPGDVLVLTKPIGTGVISTALKAGRAEDAYVIEAARWMERLNGEASQAMLDAGAHAATDITGFGLLGHLLDLCRASSVSATIEAGAVPLLPGALEFVRAGHIPGGSRTNLEMLGNHVRFGSGVGGDMETLLTDAQTSGGLLITLAPRDYSAFAGRAGANMLAAAIGRIVEGENTTIQVSA